MTKTASILYWASGSDMRLDGGGVRAAAWRNSLEALGYCAEIIGILPPRGHDTSARGDFIAGAKRLLIPMPIERRLPEALRKSDLYVATVPAVFRAALAELPKSETVLDWMDLWSINARNIGNDRLLSTVGGRVQSRAWKAREARYAQASFSNTFAGYADYEEMERTGAGSPRWLPTPVPIERSGPHAISPVQRLGFLGNFHYPPNRISLRRWLHLHAADLAASGITVVVAGFGSEMVASWGGGSIEVMGPVDKVGDFYRNIDAVVVPIEHGGGIKVKAVEALSYAVPVYATDHVREGFAPNLRHALRPVAELWTRTPLKAYTLSESEFCAAFSPEAFTRGVSAAVDALG